MHFLLPADPFAATTPDAAYADEAIALRERGCGVSLFSFEDFESGAFKPRPALPAAAEVIYRGWMLNVANYTRLQESVASCGAQLRTSAAHYRRCHYLPEWYAACADLTPKTLFAAEGDDYAALVASTEWRSYFVKDHVKSLTTARGSVAHAAAEIAEIVALIRQYRGHVEGGICIREYVDLRPESEQRFFVINGTAFASAGMPPAIVEDVARRIESPFFSVDVARTMDGKPIVIELGDGQVSDRKDWPVDRFAAILCAE